MKAMKVEIPFMECDECGAAVSSTLKHRRWHERQRTPAEPLPTPPTGQGAAPLVSVEQACEFLGISRTGLFQLMKDGELPVVKIGRRTLLTQAAIDNYIARKVR